MIASVASGAGFALFCVAMLRAGWDDLRRMKIENRLVLLLLGGYVLLAPLSGLTVVNISWSATMACLVLLGGFLMFTAGWIGGGDAKLAAVIALWLGAEQVPAYVLLLSILGALLTLAILIFRAVKLPAAWAERHTIRNLHSRREGIPYGIALAAAGLWMLSQSPWLTTFHQL